MATKLILQEYSISSEEALDFVRKMQKAFPRTPRSKADKERLRNYLAKFSDEYLRSVGMRVQGDIMMRPPRTIHAGDLPLHVSAKSAGSRTKDKPTAAAPKKRAQAKRKAVPATTATMRKARKT